jgi:hypothetical protein
MLLGGDHLKPFLAYAYIDKPKNPRSTGEIILSPKTGDPPTATIDMKIVKNRGAVVRKLHTLMPLCSHNRVFGT